ncbi:MAG: hypothetical protein COZ80_02745 [Ignavibacteria bacterium CG_4_8_14_3_um_filter_37_9]|nr:hypothetical protein [Ignavibacteria bacterium]OIO22142.1 MAG: hypothetical protein AUJ54_03925 [Ignavibacteria bacterium CG1_02_37_35]PIP76474.1 MAG: hypothetical protein COW85_14130 [Ignavibacteria bacterium CG22_combo_CG10-13_8_21_14_all_37_15]PIW99931.1 MAG: hypothetical protein COZ80_02745 [Ignavibacteria bacterium CG_4_8_14_3_um_filter_37_9]PIX94801.1 MAG: hypothetical protein COZ25_03775 [Ignavibacteria bacterium CG_4_10_14_3_um_filter_37_18]PJC58709.1 MAG: hypothetical protein CO025
MNQSEYINEEELLNKAIRLLTEKLGPLETSRFLSIAGKRRSESVKRHHQWQNSLDKEKFFKSVFNK